MLRKIDGLAKITESDKKEIEIIKEEQAKLKLDKSEQDRLKEEAETVKRENEQNRRNIEVLKEAQDAAIAYYQQQEADLAAQMRSTQADISAIGKVNYATDLRIAFSKGVKEYLDKNPDAIDPKKYCSVGREEVKKYVMSKMHVVGSVNKA